MAGVLASEPAAVRAIRKGAILVVEDEFLLADHIGSLLEAAGFEVIGPTGMHDEALTLAQRATLSAALLDVNIIGGPIDDVAETLAARGVPFNFVTAYSRDHLPPRFRKTTIVSKPFDDRRLVDHVQRLTTS